MKHVFFGTILGAGLAVAFAACSSEPAPPPAAAAPRVFFTSPAAGASVKSPVKLVFGIENYTLAAVPAGDVTEVRPKTGHHHVGVDTDCLPPGTVIPKAAPWVHFGNGSNEIEMQLPPGQHKLALELGDDKHTTIAGLCSTITVNVTE
jgi:hypothetical protein